MSSDSGDSFITTMMIFVLVFTFLIGMAVDTYMTQGDLNRVCETQYGHGSTFIKTENGHVYCKQPPIAQNETTQVFILSKQSEGQ